MEGISGAVQLSQLNLDSGIRDILEDYLGREVIGKHELVFFNDYLNKHSQEIVFSSHEIQLNFQALAAICNRLSDYLKNCGLPIPGNPVAVFEEPGVINQLVSIVASLRCGCDVILIRPNQPDEVLKSIIDNSMAPAIIFGKKHLKTVNKLLWECKSVKGSICTDTDDVYQEEPGKSKLMNKKLWELVGVNAKNDIEGGGWVNSYTREYFSKQEMDEYANNIFIKLKDFLSLGKKVLEIGCASGISMFKIAPFVGLYYGTDISNIIIEKDRQKAEKDGLKNIKLQCLPGHEIHNIAEKNFDIVIINSVTHCFNGINYLRNVILKAIELMGEEGILFIGDVMDLNKKSELVDSLINFKANHPQYRTKTDLTEELFLAKEFFEDLQADIPQMINVNFCEKIYSIKNELTEFRYDVIIQITKQQKISSSRMMKAKYQYGFDVYKEDIPEDKSCKGLM